MNCAAAPCEFRPVERGLCRTHFRATLRPRCAVSVVPPLEVLPPVAPPPPLEVAEDEGAIALPPPTRSSAEEAAMVAGVDGMIHKLARRYVKIVRGGAIDYEDLVAEGRIGALIAARRFDEAKGVKFLTYAVWWIRSRIQRFIHEHNHAVHIPVGLQERTGREKALASTDDTPRANARKLAASVGGRAVSLDAPVIDDGDLTLLDRLADPTGNPEDLLGEVEERARVRAVVASLEPRLRAVMTLRMQGKTLQEVADAHGVSRRTILSWTEQAKWEIRLAGLGGSR